MRELLGLVLLAALTPGSPALASTVPSYRRIRPGDYWVLDNASDHYNRWRNRGQGGFRWRLPASHPDGSERLADYPRQYEYAIAIAIATGFPQLDPERAPVIAIGR